MKFDEPGFYSSALELVTTFSLYMDVEEDLVDDGPEFSLTIDIKVIEVFCQVQSVKF